MNVLQFAPQPTDDQNPRDTGTGLRTGAGTSTVPAPNADRSTSSREIARADSGRGIRRSNARVPGHHDPADPDLGATTAEYGIVMLAAVGFAGLLVVILKSGEVREMLMSIVRSALSMG